jgi:hypothetical protein
MSAARLLVIKLPFGCPILPRADRFYTYPSSGNQGELVLPNWSPRELNQLMLSHWFVSHARSFWLDMVDDGNY